MKLIKRIIEDFRKGEEIDVYVTLLFTIVIAIFAIAGYDLSKYSSSLILAILALLTFSILKSRHQINELISKIALDKDDILLKEQSDKEIMERLKESKEVIIIGPILQRTIKTHYEVYEELLLKKTPLRFLLVNPNNIAADIIATRPYTNVNVSRVKEEILSTLSSLKNLEKETAGNIKIRTIDYPIAFGGFFLDTNNHKGIIYIRYYPFKMREDARPKLKLFKTDEYWFDYYSKQAEILWDNGNDWVN